MVLLVMKVVEGVIVVGKDLDPFNREFQGLKVSNRIGHETW